MNDKEKLLQETRKILCGIKSEAQPSFDLQRQYIDLCCELYDRPESAFTFPSVRIPDEKILMETIIYMINKHPNYLTVVPKDKLTYELCIDAIRNLNGSPGNLMKAIPKQFFDHDLCKEIVLKNHKLIRKIPIEIITKGFVEDLKSHGVITEDINNYINECLTINEKLDTNSVPHNNVESIQSDKYNDLQIPIQSLTDILLESNIKILQDKKIVTLKDLFIAYDNGILGTLIGETSSHYLKIMGATRLLRCKYLGVDPMIDENSGENVLDFLLDLGISRTIVNALSGHIRRFGNTYSVSDLFEDARLGTIYEKFRKIPGLGNKSIKELVTCLQIVVDYHDRHKNDLLTNMKDIEFIDDKENLILLSTELNRLIEEKNRIEKEINIVLEKIQNKVNVESKDGFSK